MENASKALLIAAGILFSVMILSLIMIAYNQISNYYTTKQETVEATQLAEFNSKFENYNRKGIRGSELISLMNRIIDYNSSQSYQTGTNYERIGVTIEIGEENLKQFKYSSSSSDYTSWDNNPLLKATITNKSGKSIVDDQKLVEVTSTVQTLSAYIGINLSDTNFQKLASNVSNILLSNSDENNNTESAKKTRQKRNTILKSVGINIALDSNYKPITKSEMDKAKSITNKYYQYMQFKRAYFDCVNVKYDEKTGRISEMNFKVRTNSSGMVEFN